MDELAETGSPQSNSSSYVDRLVAVLRLFSEEPETLGVKEISERLGLPASSVHRILEPLVRLGLVERAPFRRYRIGTELFRIAARIESRFELITLAKPLLAEIAAETSETCLLGLVTPSRSRILLSFKIDSNHPSGFNYDLLTNITPVWGSLGRSILAWLSPADVRRTLAEAEPSPIGGAPVPDWATLQADLTIIRERGVAVSHGQRAAPNAVGISAPFFDSSGQVRGGMAIVAPADRMPPERIGACEGMVKLQARHLSRLLGHHPRTPRLLRIGLAAGECTPTTSTRVLREGKQCQPLQTSILRRGLKTRSRTSTSTARAKGTV